MSEKNIRRTIAFNISYYRKQMKLTQADLASMLSVKTTTVSTWERGASLPDAETLFHICSIFGISLANMYGSEPSENVPVFLDESEHCLLKAYRNAAESRREAVRALLGIEK